MDSNRDISNKQCFKCDQKVLGNLNIAINASNSITVLWNAHQILVYEELKFTSATRIIEPEFQIYNLLLYNNHIACLDCGGNLHLISLKFKNPTQKRYKSSFQPRKQNVLALARHSSDIVLTLQYSMDILYLSFHQMNKEFQIEKEIQLLFENDKSSHKIKHEKCILQCHSISNNNLKGIKQLFNVAENAPNTDLLVTFDKLTIHACLLSLKMVDDEIQMIKIYSCPSEICNIEIIDCEDLKILIGLTIGTIIVLPLKQTDRKPITIHLNTAIYKFHITNNTLIHTDGCTMWKTENVFAKDIILNKLFVKQVKDFIIINNKIICTTFSNLIYFFSNNDSCYVKSQNVDEYLPADKLINNTDCLNKVMDEIKKNNELVNKLNEEENYITALSLSNRQDIMNNIITTKIVVYEKYEDATNEYVPITLTEEIHEYFRSESMLFLINICVDTSHTIFNSILTNLFTDLKIHISFSNENKLLKTTSIKLREQINKINYLIPLKNISTRINVNITFVVNIPGTFHIKQTAWTVLYRKHTLLNSEHFIITTNIADKVLNLKKMDTFEELMQKTTENVYGNLFKFIDTSKSLSERDEWSLYVKLPVNYPEVLKISEYTEKYLNFKTAEFLSQQYTSEEFLKSKSHFIIIVGNEKVKLEVVNDGFTNPVLKLTSRNLKVALDIRNCFAGIVYNEFNNYTLDEEFISHTFYTTVENVQKAVKNFITKNQDPEEFSSVVERFERNVIGALTI